MRSFRRDVLVAAMLCWFATGCVVRDPLKLNCEWIAKEIPGPEDFALDDLSNRQHPHLIVSGSARGFFKDASKNGLYEIDLTGDPKTATPVKISDEMEFAKTSPHGIAIRRRPDRTVALYVIDHKGGDKCTDECRGRDEVVLEFTLNRVKGGAGRLTLRECHCHKGSLTSPNDLDVTLDGDIYVTNARANRSLLTQLLRPDPVGSVVRLGADDGPAAKELRYPNGIAIDRNGDRVYVASTQSQSIHVYRRDASGELSVDGPDIIVNSAVDNLMWADDERLYVAGTISLARSAIHAGLSCVASPSEIYEIDTQRRTARLVHRSVKGGIQTASVAIPWGGYLYIGQVFESGILRCELPTHREQRHSEASR